jgi:hypothetical protein
VNVLVDDYNLLKDVFDLDLMKHWLMFQINVVLVELIHLKENFFVLLMIDENLYPLKHHEGIVRISSMTDRFFLLLMSFESLMEKYN